MRSYMGKMTIHFNIWRQTGPRQKGSVQTYKLNEVTPDMSLLEALDFLNEQLTMQGKTPIEFDSDCREGICGSCCMMVNGQAHGPGLGVATCQIYMRQFRNQDTIWLEPWRAKAFHVIKDLVIDRSALDRIIAAGSYVSVRAGPHPDGNINLIPKDLVESALDAGSCIQCGACVAVCPNASAALFTGAQVSRLAYLPQGKPESLRRTQKMVEQMDREGFGHCTNIGACEAACPKKISIDVIADMRREYLKGIW